MREWDRGKKGEGKEEGQDGGMERGKEGDIINHIPVFSPGQERAPKPLRG